MSSSPRARLDPASTPLDERAASALARAGAELARFGLSDARVRAWLGADLVSDARALLPRVHARPRVRGPAALLDLCVAGIPARRGDLPLGDDAIDALDRSGLLSIDDSLVRARASIVPVLDVLVAADRLDDASPEAARSPDLSAWNLAACLPPALASSNNVLDLGCGAGPAALTAARRGTRVLATDVDERALAFAAVNRALNGAPISSLELLASDLFRAISPDRRFDLILFNAPLAIAPGPEPVPLYVHAPEGEGLVVRFLDEVTARLAPHGEVLLHTQWTPAIAAAGARTGLRVTSLEFDRAPDGTPHVLCSLDHAEGPPNRVTVRLGQATRHLVRALLDSAR